MLMSDQAFRALCEDEGIGPAQTDLLLAGLREVFGDEPIPLAAAMDAIDMWVGLRPH